MNQFDTEDFSDITKQSMEKLIKLRDRRKQNWQELQKQAIEEFKLLDEVEKEIERRLGLQITQKIALIQRAFKTRSKQIKTTGVKQGEQHELN